MAVPVQPNRVLMAMGLDLALTLLSLYLAQRLRLIIPLGHPLNEANVALNWPVYVLTVTIWLVVLAQFNVYARRRARFRYESGLLTLAILTALLILAGALYMSFRQVSRLQFVYFGIINMLLLNAAHAARFAYRRAASNRHSWRILIVGAQGPALELADRILDQAPAEVSITGFLDDHLPLGTQVRPGIPVLGRVDQTVQIAAEKSVSEVILALPRASQERVLGLVAQLEHLPLQVSLVPDVLDLAWFMTRVEDLNGVPLLRLRESPLDGSARVVKRIMDIGLAALGLVFSVPVLVVLAILIKLDSPGPALIRQRRVGEHGRPFDMLKLRTMRWAPEDHQGDRASSDGESWQNAMPHKRRDDPRVTRVGRFLRRYSLDELPQLINVLKGEMSLVGPRPELPWLVDRYETWQRRRFAVPPGMTGWWQINGRSDRPMHLHVEDDLYYIRNYSLWLDVLILLKTVPAVLSGRGAF
ncbi:MAG: sugar transferase [Anaerolineae bacterium]|nr:sugar transferase [Anaerolineae bacterium]